MQNSDIKVGVIMKRIFKDQCDVCGKFDFLHGINGKCICENCFNRFCQKNDLNDKNLKKICEKQLTIFDKEILND